MTITVMNCKHAQLPSPPDRCGYDNYSYGCIMVAVGLGLSLLRSRSFASRSLSLSIVGNSMREGIVRGSMKKGIMGPYGLMDQAGGVREAGTWVCIVGVCRAGQHMSGDGRAGWGVVYLARKELSDRSLVRGTLSPSTAPALSPSLSSLSSLPSLLCSATGCSSWAVQKAC